MPLRIERTNNLLRLEAYPVFRRPVSRSVFAAFSAPRLTAIGTAFPARRPCAAFPTFSPASLVMLCLSVSSAKQPVPHSRGRKGQALRGALRALTATSSQHF